MSMFAKAWAAQRCFKRGASFGGLGQLFRIRLLFDLDADLFHYFLWISIDDA